MAGTWSAQIGGWAYPTTLSRHRPYLLSRISGPRCWHARRSDFQACWGLSLLWPEREGEPQRHETPPRPAKRLIGPWARMSSELRETVRCVTASPGERMMEGLCSCFPGARPKMNFLTLRLAISSGSAADRHPDYRTKVTQLLPKPAASWSPKSPMPRGR